ncbi:MAG: hypothetical protein LUC93_04140 [Planctomycetaceae bacterium]|nr:hypothetical protein [Planctomycetaceae bacterium]
MNHRLVVVALFTVIASTFPARSPAGEVVIRTAPTAWVSRLGSPVFIDVRDGTGELTLEMRGSPIHTRDRFTLTGRASETIETTLFTRSSARMEWSFGGDSNSRYVSIATTGPEGNFICVNGALYRELSAAVPSEYQVHNYPGDTLPGLWQSYAGLMAVIVIDDRDARSLSLGQREALRHWVTWSAGIVWIVGGDGSEIVREWGWQLGPSPLPNLSTMGMGTVGISAEPDTTHIIDSVYPTEDDILFDLLGGHYPSTGNGFSLTDGLGGISTVYIVVCLVVLGLVLGPVNYWLAKRWGSMLIFFALTPLAAVIGSAAIVGGTLASEGGGMGNEVSTLFWYGDDGMLLSTYGVRPGLFPPRLAFPTETLLMPEGGYNAEDLVIDRAGGLHPREGLLRPRLPAVYGTARPLKGRMRVALTDAGTVENTLGYDLEWVVVSEGKTGWARNVPAGATVTLETSRVPEDISDGVRSIPAHDRFNGYQAVVAKAAGLPYLDDGGLGMRRGLTSYYFVGLGSAGDGDD